MRLNTITSHLRQASEWIAFWTFLAALIVLSCMFSPPFDVGQ